MHRISLGLTVLGVRFNQIVTGKTHIYQKVRLHPQAHKQDS